MNKLVELLVLYEKWRATMLGANIETYREFAERFINENKQALSQHDVIKAVCDVCGSDDITEAPHMGRNCNSCNPI